MCSIDLLKNGPEKYFPYVKFSCKKFEFGLTHEPEYITSHGSDNPKKVKHKHEEVKKILLEGLEAMKKKGFLTVVLYVLYEM